MTAKIVAQRRPCKFGSRLSNTTEKLILVYLAIEKSNKVIAQNLNVAEDTVKIHMHNILNELNLTSRV